MVHNLEKTLDNIEKRRLYEKCNAIRSTFKKGVYIKDIVDIVGLNKEMDNVKN